MHFALELDEMAGRSGRAFCPRQWRGLRAVLGERLTGMELITGSDVAVGLDTGELQTEMERLIAKATASTTASRRNPPSSRTSRCASTKSRPPTPKPTNAPRRAPLARSMPPLAASDVISRNGTSSTLPRRVRLSATTCESRLETRPTIGRGESVGATTRTRCAGDARLATESFLRLGDGGPRCEQEQEQPSFHARFLCSSWKGIGLGAGNLN